jgi:phosphatidylglycerol:prolipoprotein diacylglycerol transferase
VHPIAFYLGPFPVRSYGVMMAIAFIVGLWTASRRGLREGIPAEKILDIGPWLIVGTIIGARILHVATYWNEEFAGHPLWEIFAVWKGGLVFYGGLIGASLAGILFARHKKIPLWKLADVLAPSIPLGYVFGRIGCFLNGCCFGRSCDLPWAVTYPNNGSGAPTFPVHPSQLYDSLLSLVLYLFLAWLYRRKKFDGQVFATYLLCYAVTRSIVESFRGDYSQLHIHSALHLTPGQLVSMGIFVTGIGMWAMLRRFQPKRL